MNTNHTQQEPKENPKEGQVLTNEQMEKVTGGYIPPNQDKKTK